MIDLCVKYKIEYLDIPMTTVRNQFIEDNKTVLVEITDDQNCRVPFYAIEMIGRSTTTNPFIPTSDELRYSILKYIRNN